MWEESRAIQLIIPTVVEQRLLSTPELREVRQLSISNLLISLILAFFTKPKTFKTKHLEASTWRKVFLTHGNDVFKPKDKVIYDRNSVIPFSFLGSKVKIYAGTRFHTRVITRWMVGYKFGEFSWTRKLALYKAKQLKKKKK